MNGGRLPLSAFRPRLSAFDYVGQPLARLPGVFADHQCVENGFAPDLSRSERSQSVRLAVEFVCVDHG